MPDRSSGYENIAEAFIRARRSSIGPTVVRRWATRLPAGASVLDIGCGNGVPASREADTWTDNMTGLPSYSLGHEAYEQELLARGLQLVGNDVDEGDNYYYLTVKR